MVCDTLLQSSGQAALGLRSHILALVGGRLASGTAGGIDTLRDWGGGGGEISGLEERRNLSERRRERVQEIERRNM